MRLLPRYHPLWGAINTAKYAWQRIVRGYGAYDDRMLWEFDDWFYQFRPAIKQFCSQEVAEATDEYKKLNPERIHCYEHTLDLISRWEQLEVEQREILNDPKILDGEKICELRKSIEEITHEFWAYFGGHILWYWN